MLLCVCAVLYYAFARCYIMRLRGAILCVCAVILWIDAVLLWVEAVLLCVCAVLCFKVRKALTAKLPKNMKGSKLPEGHKQ
jgi:hypothetical protein